MFKKSRHSDEGRNLITIFLKIPTFVGMTTLLLISPTFAKDKNEAPQTLNDIVNETALAEGAVRYEPENCEFEMIFPSAPYTSRRCEDGNKNCTTLTSYTMVYDVTTTIEVSVSCIPSTPEQYKSFNEKVIALALKGMVSRGNITEHEINTREEDGIRQGSLLGSAKRGLQNSLYNAQIWVGPKSVMTVESKLIGPAHDVADKVFADILVSIKKKK